MDLGKALRELEVEPVEWPKKIPAPLPLPEQEPVETETTPA